MCRVIRSDTLRPKKLRGGRWHAKLKIKSPERREKEINAKEDRRRRVAGGAVAGHVTREMRTAASKSNRDTINVRRRRTISEGIHIEEDIKLMEK